MGRKRQKNQLEVAFMREGRGETGQPPAEGIELPMVSGRDESPASDEKLMEEICQWSNLKRALKQVLRNQGGAGVDGMTVQQLPRYLYRNRERITEALLVGRYRPQGVRRKEIPKRNGGVRRLGIPTVLDRLVQQAVAQVVQRRWERTFSESSFGFRPGRSQQEAVEQAQGYLKAGYRWVVDLDLEKFFDRVNHDRLMARLARRIRDKRVLKLIRAFLNAGILENGLEQPSQEGTPQGGPLSPLLSNIVLDELDEELEARGHRFVRYADDVNIWVRSERAGQRVLASVSRFVEKPLKLRVNRDKSAVGRPWQRTILGFSFTNRRQEPKRRISKASLQRFRVQIRQLTGRTRSVSMPRMVAEVNRYLQGWSGYYGHCQTPSVLESQDRWIRRRLRALYWVQWTTSPRRFRQLRRLGLEEAQAGWLCSRPWGVWRLSGLSWVVRALPTTHFDALGLIRLTSRLRA